MFGGSSPSGRAKVSIVHTGDIGNTFARRGFCAVRARVQPAATSGCGTQHSQSWLQGISHVYIAGVRSLSDKLPQNVLLGVIQYGGRKRANCAMDKSEHFSVALWATHLGAPLAALHEWHAQIAAHMEQAAESGADLLVMPELAADHWFSFAPPGLALRDEVSWLATHVEEALDGLRPLPARYGIGLLAGTMPVPVAEGRDGAPPIVNRAHLLLPDGRVIEQDKLCLTPLEKNPLGWHLSSGDRIRIVTWHGVRMAILICLDIELPALSAQLAPHDVDIVLVPSMTQTLAGYNRVFSCARARATELLAAVGAVGCIGTVLASTGPRTNISGAAMYLPCDGSIGPHGVAAEIPPADGADDAGPLLIVPDLPIGRMRALRHGGADVWPGAWHGEHVSIVEV
jgi:predicted amidohydrolase